jgi:DNA-binding beta-propeller fold protein YncE
LVAALVASAFACRERDEPAAPAPSAAPSAGSVASPTASASASAPAPLAPRRADAAQGGAIARAGDKLYVVDDANKTLRTVSLPIDADLHAAPSVALPGRPGQVAVLGGRVFVTVRDPGLLMVFEPEADEGLVERARVPVPADAWGLAVAADGAVAIVTSAWTHQVSIVDVAGKRVKSSVDVAREPRGVVVAADGEAAYVSHLVGASLTKVPLDGGAPIVVDLPAAPLRAPYDVKLDASLGYALTLSPDGRRLFAARHAIGARFAAAWFGAPTVDVLVTSNDKPIVPPRRGPALGGAVVEQARKDPTLAQIPPDMVQPRALAYRSKSKTLLVVSEGRDAILELDATAVDPSARALVERSLTAPHPNEPVATQCSAPSGVALSADEDTAYVWCAGSFEVASIELQRPPSQLADSIHIGKLADDPLTAKAARGRRIFLDAADGVTSGGMACAGCHPEGRDDAHVWAELPEGPETKQPIFVGMSGNVDGDDRVVAHVGYARQTPMLAGRVAAEGPYGWHAQNDTLAARAVEGMGLHRWFPPPGVPYLDQARKVRAEALAEFLRSGLAPPPRDAHPPTPAEARGKELFSSPEVGCSGCHVPETDYTNRVAVPLPERDPPDGYAYDPNEAFKTPSLSFVGGTAPYYHDGSARSLEDLVRDDDDRMGKTKQLSEPDRAALVAFLRTL